MKIYDQCKLPQDLPMESEGFIDSCDITNTIGEELGISQTKSRSVTNVLYGIIEQAILTGKTIRIGNHLALEPVHVTEAVGAVYGNSAVYKVIPQHKEYRLRLSESMQQSVYGDVQPFFVLTGTGKKLTKAEADRFKGAFHKRSIR